MRLCMCYEFNVRRWLNLHLTYLTYNIIDVYHGLFTPRFNNV